MRIGVFRRSAAFLLDAMPIILILSLLLSLFVGDILKSQYSDFDEKITTYQENMDDYYATLDVYKEQLEEEEITLEDYEELSLDLQVTFVNDNEEYRNVVFGYYSNVVLFYLLSFTVVNYFYHLILKGQTYGRKLMKIELYGNITWYTLLLREVLWKSAFWVFTFSIGILIDVLLVAFTTKKKTIRDLLTETELRYSGTSYPF